jgi:acyl-coenzyme A thioesterase PaaI-like protein
MTVDMNISYISPVVGGVIEAHAKALREGRIVPAEVDIINDNKLVAKAIATYIIVDDKKD